MPLWRRLLYQLSYTRLSGARGLQIYAQRPVLNYETTAWSPSSAVDRTGFEPVTPAMPWRCSTS